MVAGAIEAQDRQRIDPGVDVSDALFQDIEQVERRDLPCLSLPTIAFAVSRTNP